jgi:hypothetical protein
VIVYFLSACTPLLSYNQTRGAVYLKWRRTCQKIE